LVKADNTEVFHIVDMIGRIPTENELRAMGKEHLIKYLIKNNIKYCTIINNVPDIVVVIGMDGRFRFVSPQVQAILGYTPDEVIGHNSWQFIHPIDVSKIREAVNDAINGKADVIPVEFRVKNKDGEYLYLSGKGTLMTEGEDTVYVGILRDLTALVKSEEKYRVFVKNFNGIVYQGRLDFVPIFFHGTVEELTGYTESEFITGNPRWDQIIHPGDYERIVQVDSKDIEQIPNYSQEREYRIIRKCGTVKWIHEFIQNVADDFGNIMLVQGVIHDITERKLLELCNERHSEILKGISDPIDDISIEGRKIFARLAHGINNPIMGIINYSTILKTTLIEYFSKCSLCQRREECKKLCHIDTDLLKKPFSFLDGLIIESKRIVKIINNFTFRYEEANNSSTSKESIINKE
jgi:PAS domain S-box-containing protein